MQIPSRFALVMLFAIAVSLSFASGGEEKDGDAKPGKKEPFASALYDKARETHEERLAGTFAGKALAYVAKTGFTPIFSEDGDEQAWIFSTSYLLEGGDRERPVTFLFNGGPGSSSNFLHAGAFGPKIFPTLDKGLDKPIPPYKLSDNPDSPLDVSDLVFVDPVGTGYSHVVADGKDGKESKPDKTLFWNGEADLKSLTEFIRVWLEENNRWGARVFIAGESYGGFRAAGLASRLSSIGVVPSGIAMISPVLSYEDQVTDWENHLGQILLIPSLAATAQFHHKLDPDLQKLPVKELTDMVSDWCHETYLPALLKGNRISPSDFDAIAAELSRFTSIAPEEIKSRKLRLTLDVFSDLLLRDSHQTISAYDGRVTAPARSSRGWDEDPIYNVAGEAYQAAFKRFLSETMKMKTFRSYVFTADDAFRHWDFTLGHEKPQGYPSTVDALSEGMRRFPYLRVFLAMGRYDMVTSAEGTLQSMARLDIPTDRLQNIDTHLYEGGHMMYTNPGERHKLCADLRQWILDSSSGR